MKISIIIPTIGRETLHAVLDALILNKKSVQFEVEIIVVFDAVEPFESLSQKDITILKTQKKAYAGGARNLGLSKATGDIIVFIGDDTIPADGWLQQIHDWHLAHTAPEAALLGRVDWVDRLASDRFHRWMNDNAQFDYRRLDQGFPPGWQHFYTSNISVKRALVGDELFHEGFRGWGFEDAEFGYRLAKRGMNLHYDGTLQVFHDDEQSLQSLKTRTQAARHNALVFELLHPEVRILPRWWKRLLLRLMILLMVPLSFIPEVKWWRMWKREWIG